MHARLHARLHAFLRRLRRPLAALLAAAGAGLGGAAAQPVCPPPLPALDPAALQATARDRGFLWRVQKDGRSSWLYGTIHVGRPEWVVPGPTVARALAESDVLAVEIDPADPATLQAMLRQLAGPVPALDGPRRQRMERAAAAACAPTAMLQSLRPTMQVMTLATSLARQEGMYPELAIDFALLQRARGAGKRVVALESAEQQIAALTPPSAEEELTLVDRSLDDIEAGRSRPVLRRMGAMWAEGDEQALQTFPQWCECMRTPQERALQQRLNDARNPAMADRVAALHAGGERVFAAVGLAHMAGPQALPDLLRARGFSVQRIPFSPQSSTPPTRRP